MLAENHLPQQHRDEGFEHEHRRNRGLQRAGVEGRLLEQGRGHRDGDLFHRDGAELGSILPLSLPPFCSVIVSAREEGYFAGMRAKMRAKGRSAFVATFVLLQLFGLCSKRCMLQHGVLRCKLAHCVALRCTISTVLYHVGRCTVLQ